MVARLGAVVLAAGGSERMGSPKALMAWGTTTLLGYALQQARAAGVDEIVVVLGPATSHLAQQLLETRVAINAEPETGRSTSIRLGCEAMTDDVAAVLIQSVDQPCPANILTALFEAVDQVTDLAVPTFAGRRGHPVVFAGRLLPELREVNEQEQGLRSVVRRHADQLVEVPVADESVLWNLNDPQAYAAARARTS
jgi:molybdenum cofactor cytidylyltransferase